MLWKQVSEQGGGQDRLRELTGKRKYMGNTWKSPHVRTTRQTLSKNQKKKKRKFTVKPKWRRETWTTKQDVFYPGNVMVNPILSTMKVAHLLLEYIVLVVCCKPNLLRLFSRLGSNWCKINTYWPINFMENSSHCYWKICRSVIQSVIQHCNVFAFAWWT